MRMLNILTPVSRPENLDTIYNDLLKYTDKIAIYWWIVMDASISDFFPIYYEKNFQSRTIISPVKNAVGGHLHRNMVFDRLRTVSGAWIYMLDDDNLIHPDLVEFYASDNLEADAYLFSLLDKYGNMKFEALSNRVTTGYIDTAMILFKSKVIKNFRWTDHYTQDGYFIEHLYKNLNSRFRIISTPMAYYNYLR